MFKSQMLRLLFGAFFLMALSGTAATAQTLAPELAATREPAASCLGCQQFEATCTANCSALETQEVITTCLLACAKVAATCSCDEAVTLSSEDVVNWGLAEGPFDGIGLKAACHSTTPCPAEYGSCGSWSSYSDCGDPYCGIFKFCGDPPWCYEPDLCFGPATRQRRERFRVCFNASAQSCTEYQQTNYPVSCGC